MCDYSLEHYQSRPAVAGERYETHRFPSGSTGFVSPGNRDVAVCMAYDTRLKIDRIPETVQKACEVTGSEEAVFTRLEHGPYLDGVRFANNTKVSLQQLGPGVRADVIDTLSGNPHWKRETVKA